MHRLRIPLLAATLALTAPAAAYAQDVSPGDAQALYNRARTGTCLATSGSGDAAWTCTLQRAPRQVTLAYDGAVLTLGVLLQACENQATLNGRFPGQFRFAPGQNSPLCNVPTAPYLARVNSVRGQMGGMSKAAKRSRQNHR